MEVPNKQKARIPTNEIDGIYVVGCRQIPLALLRGDAPELFMFT